MEISLAAQAFSPHEGSRSNHITGKERMLGQPGRKNVQ
jgi:hypothetical protein